MVRLFLNSLKPSIRRFLGSTFIHLKLHYTDNGQGLALIFLHGGYVDSDIWKPQRLFFEKQFRTIIPDLRGHGKSAGTNDTEYSVEMLSLDIIQLMDELGIKKAIFCGLSLGAMMAQWIASRHSYRVHGVCLVGAVASLKLTPLEYVITTFLFPKWFALYLFGKLSTKQFLKLSFFLTWFMRGNQWLGDSTTRSIIRASIGKMNRQEIKKIYAAFHTFRKQPLNHCDFPALIINGSNDSPIIHFHGRYLKKCFNAHGDFLKIKGSGHACNYDNPEKFNALLNQWILKEIKHEQKER